MYAPPQSIKNKYWIVDHKGTFVCHAWADHYSWPININPCVANHYCH